MTREVGWAGIHNARDLGGLPCRVGSTQSGRIFRMPRPDTLTERGWAELERAGVRTLIDLRDADEIAELPLRPASVSSIHRPIEDQGDVGFMELMAPFLDSPTHYSENLRRWPEQIAAVIRTVGNAPDGAVVLHCSAGRDRTGLITAIILRLGEVRLEAILDDYEWGVRATNCHLSSQESRHEEPRGPVELNAGIAEARTTLTRLLTGMNVTQYLLDAGCSPADLDNVTARLLD